MTATDDRATDDTTAEPPGPLPAAASRSLGLQLARLRPFAGPLVLLSMILYFTALYGDRYFSKTNLVNNVLGAVAFVAIVAAGQTVVMVVGEFDLSVGGLAALASVSTGVLVATSTIDGDPTDPSNVLLAVLLGLVIGLIGGAFNGFLVSRLGILAFIATLATSVVFSNFAGYRVDGKPVYNLVENNFVEIARGDVLGIPNRVLIALAIAAVIWFLLDQTPLGRKMYAVGGNPDAARYSGINVKNTRLIAFAICGVTAAAAGILQSANNATANLTAPEPWMLQSIAAVFLGMAMFRNGLPNLPGTLLGVVMLRVLENGLNYTSIDDNLQDVILGFAILVAVLPLALSRLRAAR
ncbi:MAG: ABC transporter permease [Acidimicrobiales bacterium]